MTARTGRPSLTEAQVAERKSIILIATIDLIAELGTEAVRMKDVARKASISVGTIQYYFDSREDLIVSAYQQHTKDVIKRVNSSFNDGYQPWASLEQTLHDFLHIANFTKRTRLWIEFVASAARHEKLRDLLHEVFLAWKQVVRRIIEAGVYDGSFTPLVDTEIVVDALLAQLDGFEIAHATRAKGTDVERIETVLQHTARVLLGAATTDNGAD